MSFDINKVIADAEQGIGRYLDSEIEKGDIDQQLHDDAGRNTLSNLRQWLEDHNIDRLSPNLKGGITDAIDASRWEDLVNAFRKHMSFGTGGIRGLMASDKASIEVLARDRQVRDGQAV
jgi:hypothetical protein